MPDEYKIRAAEAEDLFKIAKVHVDCWRTTYKGIVPVEKLNSLSYERSSEKWKGFFSGEPDCASKILLLDHNEQTVGFCAGGKVRKFSKRTAGYEGEIKALYILREHQKKGFGRLFIKQFEEIFQNNGIFSYIIWVLKDNGSKEFYEKLGGQLITKKNYEIGGEKLKGLCYGYKTAAGR